MNMRERHGDCDTLSRYWIEAGVVPALVDLFRDGDEKGKLLAGNNALGIIGGSDRRLELVRDGSLEFRERISGAVLQRERPSFLSGIHIFPNEQIQTILITDNSYNNKQILVMEKTIFGNLEWQYVFLVRFITASMSDPKLLPNAQKERKLINSGDNNLFLSASQDSVGRIITVTAAEARNGPKGREFEPPPQIYPYVGLSGPTLLLPGVEMTWLLWASRDF
ncbi:hypothetical protein F2Q69_00045564 [Brassica cretica]|uniref:Uncharacterized protein n=1 Tax=Brassica cretica TaxID=69181 RepID=A0A8S9NRL4_BRACR|nr:hypothetical protein F2Q69_00045564 [Brassica cretica]